MEGRGGCCDVYLRLRCDMYLRLRCDMDLRLWRDMELWLRGDMDLWLWRDMDLWLWHRSHRVRDSSRLRDMQGRRRYGRMDWRNRSNMLRLCRMQLRDRM